MRGPNVPNNADSPNGNPRRGVGWIIWIAIGVIAIWGIFMLIRPGGDAGLSISYSSLVEQVESGSVAEVTIQGQQVRGTFTEEMRLLNGNLVDPEAPLPSDVTPLQAPSDTEFRATVPEAAATDVLALLERNGVVITAEEAGGGGFLSGSGWLLIVAIVLPLVFIVAFMMFMGRNLSRGQENALSFGRSQARVASGTNPRVTFEDVAGEDEAKSELAQVVDFLRNPGKYQGIGARTPRGVLLVGPPGTGKTLLAKAVAGEANASFFSISASEFVEMFVGVGASRVRDLFSKAKQAAPAIVFVDELDAVGKQRFAGPGAGNDEREHTLNQLLVELDGFEPHDQVIVLAATNRPDVLDAALRRPGRFDRQVALGLPDRRGREAILSIHLRSIPLGQDVEPSTLAAVTPGFSGADLANFANTAALVAAQRDKRVVEQTDFDAALDRILLGAERPMIMSEYQRRVLAYHEAGHAIVAFATPGADPLRKISIIPRGQALGVTVQAPDEDAVNYSRTYLLGRITAMLGGRAAEQLIFDEVTTGAQNDIKGATTLAQRMVGLWGMSQEVGLFFLGSGEEHAFLGSEIGQDPGISEVMRNRAEAATQQILNDAFARAHEILTTHRQRLDLLATTLLTEETLNQDQIVALLGRPDPPIPDLAHVEDAA